jgi:hypothetical protein
MVKESEARLVAAATRSIPVSAAAWVSSIVSGHR